MMASSYNDTDDDYDDDDDDDDQPRQPAEVTLTRAEVAQRIAARLEGALSNKQLATWAFDRFYEFELGTAQAEPPYEDVIQDILDELMFSDDDSFELDEASLRSLLARLEDA
jgi:hypothetical protein